MTQPQLARLCRTWQKRLRLSDWDIRVDVLTEAEMPDCVGQIPYDTDEMTAVLRLRDDVTADPEKTIIHELLHLRLMPFSDGADDEPHHEAREVAINLLADCFLRVYPRRRKAE